MIHLLALQNIRGRYARSVLGQFWLTLSVAFLIGVTGVVWSMIWGMTIDEYLPYIGTGHVIFLYISVTISESTTVIVNDARLYVNERQPFLLSIFAHQYRAVITLAHNIPIIVVLVLWSSSVGPAFDPLYPIYFALVILFLFFLSYCFAILATRYRDLIQLIGSIMQISFLISPVMWNISMLPAEARPWVFANPIAAGLELLRNPLIGWDVDPLAIQSMLFWTIFAAIAAVILHRVWDRSTIYWI